MTKIEIISITLGSWSVILGVWSVILGFFSLYLSFEIKKKKNYWKKILRTNHILQKNFKELEKELSDYLKKARDLKKIKEINFNKKTDEQIKQNNQNIEVLLMCLNNVFIRKHKEVNIFFNGTFKKLIEQILFFIEDNYSTNISVVSSEFYKNLSLLKEGLLFKINDDYLDKEKMPINVCSINGKYKKVETISLQNINELISDCTEKSPKIYWNRNLEFGTKKENLYDQSSTFEINEKYLLMLYNDLTAFVSNFNQLVKSRKGFNNWIKYYFFHWEPEQEN